MELSTQVFEEIKTSLKGTKVLKTPRVSRETIISVLQTHTDLILSLKKDNMILSDKVVKLEKENVENKNLINELKQENIENKKEIENLYRLSDEFRKEMDELSAKVAELYLLKKQIMEQKEFLDKLASKFDEFHIEVSEFMVETKSKISSISQICDDTQFQLKELKHYVDHFADNLVLSSGQISVETNTGFSTKTLTLTEILKICNDEFKTISTNSDDHSEKIKKIFSELEQKAPDSVLFNINTLEKKVATIEVHLRKEEEQGIGAIRKACDELTINIQSISAELADKIDKESVGYIVHEKYEEIVRYLQDALQSSLEDENNFKQKADEIQEMVKILTNSKADRSEIANMQEILVKSEAMLKKVGSQLNVKDKIKEFVTRKELENHLSLKLDKLEFEQQVQNTILNSKRNRKQSAFSTSHPQVTDAISNINSLTNEIESHSRKSSIPPILATQSSNYNLNQINALSNNQDDPLDQLDHEAIANEIENALDENLHLRSSSADNLKNKPPKKVPVIAIGRGYNSSPPRSAPKTNKSGEDFSTFAKGKIKSHMSNMNAMMNLPSNMNPGEFRSASEGGKPGGWRENQPVMPQSGLEIKNHSKETELNSESPLTQKGKSSGPTGYGRSEYPYVPPNFEDQSAAKSSHLEYLSGPVVGGGFNLKKSHLKKATAASSPVPEDDIEGKGMMLQGTDGHFYYKDLRENES